MNAKKALVFLQAITVSILTAQPGSTVHAFVSGVVLVIAAVIYFISDADTKL